MRRGGAPARRPRVRPGPTAWNTAVDQRPAAVAYPADPAEVAALLRAARAVGLRVASQGTGHHADALGPLDDTILLRTAAMTGLSVDRAARRARVGAGMLWVDVVDAVSPLAALHPAAPDVGVVGFSLSGGLSWYGRALGLQSNAITAVELVTAGGDAVRADADHEADLFWALRGGGANFGVVTALEFALHPVPEVHAGLLAWDAARAERVLAAWVDWAASAPETVTTAARVMPAPGALTDLRGRQLLVVNGAVLGPAGAALAPLRGLRPEVDTFARVPAAALARLHLEPEDPAPTTGASRWRCASSTGPGWRRCWPRPGPAGWSCATSAGRWVDRSPRAAPCPMWTARSCSSRGRAVAACSRRPHPMRPAGATWRSPPGAATSAPATTRRHGRGCARSGPPWTRTGCSSRATRSVGARSRAQARAKSTARTLAHRVTDNLTREPEMNAQRTGHAVVIGASMAGLLAARVLTETFARVTVVDRDALPDEPLPRRAVPQSRHAHGLLARGREILEDFFPASPTSSCASTARCSATPSATSPGSTTASSCAVSRPT
ncbi:FAD-binding protein [Luedemannella flava]